jgi:Holliday junction resolvase RusA-like endonuclease
MMFVLQIPPTGQRRARSRAFNAGGGKFIAQTYKAKEQRLEENRLITLLYEHRPPEPMRGPLALLIRAYLPTPTMSKKKRLAASLDEIRPTVKPDADNLAKQILDCMNGVFFGDDKQIVDLRVQKLYGDIPRWEIALTPWPPF